MQFLQDIRRKRATNPAMLEILLKDREWKMYQIQNVSLLSAPNLILDFISTPIYLCLSMHCRYPGDGVCLCHHGCWRDPCCDPGLQHGRPPAVRLWGNQEPTTSEAPLIFLLWRRSQVGVGGMRGRRGVWLRKVETVYGCQEEKREERHQGTYWSA